MQSKKGAELIRAILKYVGEMNGFDRHMQKVSQFDWIVIKFDGFT